MLTSQIRGTLVCRDAEQTKVALMFLTRSSIIHQELWILWLRSAVDLTDAPQAQFRHCHKTHLCQQAAHNRPFGQTLFSVYVHSGKQDGSAETVHDNKFNSFMLASNVETQWGEPSLMVAERALIQNALLDAFNQRFVLLSESCIPLYPPQLIYQQLIGESRSRVNTCRNYYKGSDKPARYRCTFICCLSIATTLLFTAAAA